MDDFLFIFLACEQVVSRSFPVSTLTREKKINVLYLNHIEHWLQECIQLRSHMFQVKPSNNTPNRKN